MLLLQSMTVQEDLDGTAIRNFVAAFRKGELKAGTVAGYIQYVVIFSFISSGRAHREAKDCTS